MTDEPLYKLALIQVGQSWEWFLQRTTPIDFPFNVDRAECHGESQDIRGAIRQAHHFVPQERVEYIYLDRRDWDLDGFPFAVV